MLGKVIFIMDNTLRNLRDLIHEIKDPFAAVHGGLELVLRGAIPPDDLAFLHRSMARNAQVMKTLLDDASLYLGLLTDPPPAQAREVDLGALLEQAVEAIRPLLAGREQNLDIDASRLLIAVQSEALERAVSCLIGALSRVSPRGARFYLSGRKSRADAVSISLTGEERENGLKENDFRAALAAELARWMGGDLESSGGGDRPLRLTLTVPVDELATGASEEPSPNVAASPPVSPPSVVIVEDNPIASQVMARMVERMGLAARVASTGPDGLAEILRDPPGLVLCDLGLPGEYDGFGLAQRLREANLDPPLPLIAFTGDATGARADALRSGFDQVLDKPLGESSLRSLFEQHGLL